MTARRGIVLAGGLGTRLYPVTLAVSKQLLPVYDKPMIYYPLTTLMLAGVRDIAVISTPLDLERYHMLLGCGEDWGLNFTYLVQPDPGGLPEAFIIAEKFLAGSPSVLILGDNVFYGASLGATLKNAAARDKGATVFAYRVKDPERYGVVEFSAAGQVLTLEEKPPHPKSRWAVTGLYFFDGTAPARAKLLSKSERGELEIIDLIRSYLTDGLLSVDMFGRGFAWLDTGTYDALSEASAFIEAVQKRQGLMVACPEEIAYNSGWIGAEAVERRAEAMKNTPYAEYLRGVLQEKGRVF
ncbi:MAG: glucose-1-phosphate thymidylyltransferase RfbA [Synergistaceae bacterium]|jgi:glucose-1-phosphate thymidylyltransferase|nr:glucose-1-phosphate thymidylyltransferase RfbA [Synergistaceae bacterium]